jgi:tetratricopeptide (TPR) repeat protein
VSEASVGQPQSPGEGRPAAGPAVSSAAEEVMDAGVTAFVEYESSGRPEALEAAVAAFKLAAATLTADDPGYAACHSSLGGCLLVRFERTGNVADLDAAIDAGQKAVVGARSGDRGQRAAALSNLSMSLLARHGLAGDRADLDAAIDVGRESVSALGPGQEERAMCLSNLSAALLTRYELTGSQPDLDAAIGAGRQSLDGVPRGHPDRPALLSTLGNCLLRRFQAGRDPDPDEAIAAFRGALAGAVPGHPSRAADLSNLGAALRARFERTGDVADLDAAIDAGRHAADALPPSHPDLEAVLAGLAASLGRRFERAGDDADLDAAIDAGRRAASATPPGHPDLPGRLSNLTAFLGRRFERAGDDADLDAAIDAGRRAASATPPGHPDLTGRLSNLSASYLTRFDRAGAGTDLDAAVDTGHQAAEALRPDDPGRCTILSNLGTALFRRFQGGQAKDLDAAITALDAALSASAPGRPDQAMCLLNLSAALRNRSERDGTPADLAAAIALGRQAVDASPPDRPGRTSYLSSLAATYFTRFGRTGDQADLEGAIDLGRQAVAGTRPGDAQVAGRLASLGTFLSRRFTQYADEADLDAAIDCWRQAGRAGTGTPGARLSAARSWGSAAARAGRVRDAAAGYEAAVGLLPTAAWHGIDRASRESLLAQWAGLAADAGALAVADGHPERAVELLEQGRSVLWNQALNLRGDLTELAAEHPAITRRLDRLRGILDSPPTADPGHSADASELRRRAAREWDELLAQVRTMKGFEHFLTATPYRELVTAIEGGPVVIVNASRHGCDALIVEPGSERPRIARLPAVTTTAAAAQANALLAALAAARDPDRTARDLEDGRLAVLDVLGWLWDAVAEPVLAELGRAIPPEPGDPLPRVWWSLTGALSVLPVHAAGHYPRDPAARPAKFGDSVLDLVISSYTPTIGALARAARPAMPGPERHLTVSMPSTPGMTPLPSAKTELEILARHFPPGEDNQQLTGPKATRSAVRAALSGHSWAHFACHAGQLYADTGDSGFALWDGALSVTDLAAEPGGEHDLAFLSACQTAAPSLRHLDEALHLAAAMQFLGYRHVIATQWAISDFLAPRVTDSFYASLTSYGPPLSTRAPLALHHAVQALRRAHPANPLSWAPYIHLGP